MPGEAVAVTVDTLVEGGHFFPHTDPRRLGRKALAVNLSDLAAMGAVPLGWTLLLQWPAEGDEAWLEPLVGGLEEETRDRGVRCLGATLCRGPLALTIQAIGRVSPAGALRRDRGRPGQRLAVTGHLGVAAWALRRLEAGERLDADDPARLALELPEPQLAAGRALVELATAAIDLSDGLLQDLGHILRASGVGATLELERLPLEAGMVSQLGRQEALRLALAGGDDYQLCFSYDPLREEEVARRLAAAGVAWSPIGWLEAEAGVRLRLDGRPFDGAGITGWDPFRGAVR